MFNAGGCGRLYVFMNSPHLPQPKTDLREVRAVAPRGYGGAAPHRKHPARLLPQLLTC